MARVPVQQQRTVQPQGLPRVFQSSRGATIDAFGGDGSGGIAAGRSIQQAGDTLEQFALEIQQDANDAEAKRLEVEWRTEAAKLLYGDGTEQNPGYFSSRSNNALDGYQPTRQQLERLRADIEARATNNNVRDMFSDQSTGQMLGHLDRMGAHVGSERLTALTEASVARMGVATNDAALNFNDPAAYNEAVAINNNEVMAQARINGWDDETIALKQAEAQDTLTIEVVRAAVERDPSNAYDMFSELKFNMTPAARAALADEVLESTKFYVAQEWIAENQSILDGMSITEQMQYARAAIDNGEVAETATNFLIEDFRIQQAVLSAYREEVRWGDYVTAKEDEEQAEAFILGLIQEGVPLANLMDRAIAEGSGSGDFGYLAALGKAATSYVTTAETQLNLERRDLAATVAGIATEAAGNDENQYDTLMGLLGEYGTENADVIYTALGQAYDTFDAAEADRIKDEVLEIDKALSNRDVPLAERLDLAEEMTEDREVLDAYSALLTGQARTEATLEDAENRAFLENAQALARQYRDASPQERAAMIGTIENDRQALLVQEELERLDGLKTNAEIRRINDNQREVSSFVNNGDGTLNEWLRANPDKADDITGDLAFFSSLRTREQQMAADRVPAVSDPLAFVQLTQAFRPENLPDLMEHTQRYIIRAQTTLSTTDYNRWSADLAAVLEGGPPPSIRTHEQIVSDTMASFGFTDPNGDEDQAQIYQDAITALTNAQADAGPTPISELDQQTMVNRLLMKYDSPDISRDADEPFLEEIQEWESFEEDVPQSLQDAVAAAVRAVNSNAGTTIIDEAALDDIEQFKSLAIDAVAQGVVRTRKSEAAGASSDEVDFYFTGQ